MKHSFGSPLQLLTLVVCGAMVTTLACTPEAPETKTSVETRPEAVEPQTESTSATESDNVQTYDGTEYQFPLMAKYPDSMQVEDGCAGEGCGFFFTFVPQGNALDNAEVHVFLPAGAASVADLESLVTGPNGLIDNAGWIVNSIESGDSTQFPYDWVETVISFSGDQGEAGYILLGQTSGQAVQVLLKYPAEMADEYWPAATTILDSLEFEEELLPLTPTNV
jgi:hypothetical protein